MVMEVIDRTLRLTWRKGLFAVTVCVALVLANLLASKIFHVEMPSLLAPVAGFPLWAISAAVYTFDSLMLGPKRGCHRSVGLPR